MSRLSRSGAAEQLLLTVWSGEFYRSPQDFGHMPPKHPARTRYPDMMRTKSRVFAAFSGHARDDTIVSHTVCSDASRQ